MTDSTQNVPMQVPIAAIIVKLDALYHSKDLMICRNGMSTAA